MSELVGPVVHRPLARPLVRLFVRTGVEPALATVLGLVACLVAAVLYGLGSAACTIAAGILVMVGAVLDCVDGGAAAATGRATAWRSWIDTIADRIGDTAVAVGITWQAAAGGSSDWVWVIGVGAGAAMVLSSYARKEFELLFGAKYPQSLLDRLARRDVRTLGLFVASLALRPFAGLVVLGAISLASVAVGVVRNRDATRIDGR